MVRLTLSLITAFLASTYLASPILPDTTTTEDELVALYGPMSTWKEIKLVDAFPGALIDGAPADPDVVYARIPPAIANKTPNIAPRDDSSAQECYNGDGSLLWTSQYQMRSVLAHFCTDASNHGISNGAEYGGTYTKYLSASGSWADFTDSYGVVTPWVWYWIKVNNGFIFNFDYCVKNLNDIINCRGGIPDSRGGNWDYDNGGQTSGKVKPAAFK